MKLPQYRMLKISAEHVVNHPTALVAEWIDDVVTCGECARSYIEEEKALRCIDRGEYVTEDDYCSFGWRKE